MNYYFTSQNAASDFVLSKYVYRNDAAIYVENVPNNLKLMQKVTSTRNLRSYNKGTLINANQQSETFEKQTNFI